MIALVDSGDNVIVLLEKKKGSEALGRWFKSSRCQLLYQRPATERLASGAEAGAPSSSSLFSLSLS